MTTKILSFGEIIWDIYDTESFIGGAGLNFAAHCARCGADSFLFSAVGKDALGKKATDIISGFSINQQFIKQADEGTGRCIVKLDANGTPDFQVLENTAYDNIAVSDEDISLINSMGFDALYFGTLIQRDHVSRESLRKLCQHCNFKEIVCDINLRENCYDRESIEFCLENATILKISEEEEPKLRAFDFYPEGTDALESICRAICEEYNQIKYLIFTLGGKGALVYCAESKQHFVKKAKSVTVASTVGAGDSFIAAWMTAYLSGETAETATKRATELSGFVVSKESAIPDYTFSDGVIYPEIKGALLCDMHVHSRHSHDSKSPVRDIAEACIRNHVSLFAVTDHCDIEYSWELDAMSCVKNSIKEAEEAAAEFNGRVKILRGIELGEGIWNKTYTEEILSSYDFDVVIGSVHAVRYKDLTDPYSVIDFSKMPPEELDGYLNQYFDDVLTMMQEIPCDIAAHLTCPLRYINGKYHLNVDARKYQDKIRKILAYMIDHAIALEVNTSGVSTELGCFMPDEWIVKMFKDMGGSLVTLGSDAHIPEHVGRDFEKALQLLQKYGFENYYYYQDRKSIPCSI